MKRWLVCLALWGAGFCCALVASELLTRRFFPQPRNGSFFTIAPGGYLIPKASSATPFEVQQRRGQYRTNALHLRGALPDSARVRIAVAGDSFVFGHGLRQEDTLVALLQRKAEERFGPGEFAFYNAGIPGAGAAQYIAFLEDYTQGLRLDAVIVFLNETDIERSMDAGPFRYVPQGTTLVAARVYPRSALFALRRLVSASPVYISLIEHSHFARLVRLAAVRAGIAFRQVFQGSMVREVRAVRQLMAADEAVHSAAVGEALFRYLHQLCQRRFVRLMVITTGWEAIEEANASRKPTSRFPLSAGTFFAHEGIPFYSLKSEVGARILADAARYTIAAPRDWHPNEEGVGLQVQAAWPAVVPFLEELIGG